MCPARRVARGHDIHDLSSTRKKSVTCELGSMNSKFRTWAGARKYPIWMLFEVEDVEEVFFSVRYTFSTFGFGHTILLDCHLVYTMVAAAL